MLKQLLTLTRGFSGCSLSFIAKIQDLICVYYNYNAFTKLSMLKAINDIHMLIPYSDFGQEPRHDMWPDMCGRRILTYDRMFADKMDSGENGIDGTEIINMLQVNIRKLGKSEKEATLHYQYEP